MCNALSQASRTLHDWICDHPSSYPPMVISVTDGAATDGDPVPLAEEIMAMETNDGNVLIYNAPSFGNIRDAGPVPVRRERRASRRVCDADVPHVFGVS